ncbi:MAG: dihydroxyacetone kinase subunit L [Planctomycetes bacterium]|nr:dihydroxyacetone kinase subunit L [Planctomycetota bacterium]
MASFSTKDGARIVLSLVDAIHANKEYLSEIDGAIGDGDHGINMNKGFTLFKERLVVDEATMGSALKELGKVLLTEIGGSMGPIYGTFFLDMAGSLKGKDVVDATVFSEMLRAALTGVQDMGSATVGDKTLLDTLIPATEAFERELAAGGSFGDCLSAMESAAKSGWESTRDLEAKVGRSSRLGKRSIGVLDAGATSCWLILKALADGMRPLVT